MYRNLLSYLSRHLGTQAGEAVWHPAKFAGPAPSPRKAAAAAFVLCRFVLLFGGTFPSSTDGTEVLLDDLWAVELDEGTGVLSAHAITSEGPWPSARTSAVLQVPSNSRQDAGGTRPRMGNTCSTAKVSTLAVLQVPRKLEQLTGGPRRRTGGTCSTHSTRTAGVPAPQPYCN